MEYTPLNIYERLTAGESEDVIAKEIAENLNKEMKDYYNAVVKQKTDQYTSALNEAIAMRKNGNKEKDAAAVAETVNAFMHKYYSNTIPEDEHLNGKDVINLLDMVVNITNNLESIVDDFISAKQATSTAVKEPPMDSIQQFLKNAGLL